MGGGLLHGAREGVATDCGGHAADGQEGEEQGMCVCCACVCEYVWHWNVLVFVMVVVVMEMEV